MNSYVPKRKSPGSLVKHLLVAVKPGRLGDYLLSPQRTATDEFAGIPVLRALAADIDVDLAPYPREAVEAITRHLMLLASHPDRHPRVFR